VYVDLEPKSVPIIQAGFDELRMRAEHWLRNQQRYQGRSTLIFSADMRYRGQSYEIEAELQRNAVAKGDVAAIADAFHKAHQRVYEHSDRNAEVQVINLRLVIVGHAPKPTFSKHKLVKGKPRQQRQIEVYLRGRREKIPLYMRDDLMPGQAFASPA